MFIPDLINSNDGPFISVEFLPPRREAEWEGFQTAVEKIKAIQPLFAAVTCGAGGSGSLGTLKASRNLAEEHGFNVMPHVACVHSKLESLKQQLDDIKACGIRNVLAVRGDYPEGVESAPEGLRYASDLVQRINELAPDLAVGVAAYPDGHPESRSIIEDIEFLKLKLDAGAAFGVTQLFFDNRRYFDMVDRLAAMGCHKPIIPSVLPVRTLGQIKRVTQLCDAPVPGNTLAAIENAHAKGGNDAVMELGIQLAADQIADLIKNGAHGVHIYPFNRADMCVDILERAGLM
ncbi:methylenetetrahydrofolate reductase [Pseudodesulfovibrio sp. zrk46]|uniref:methylenetetrahydrofolate reductase n=1 Tax=Pseudodesulfovibrio sp. zrk46 TaxID=2725288 RepID=UPI001449F19B|nr:methylenetetrahydrofolate reductase [Pseudodesulfovibrio sp. zrk46]QJB55943.1 5,10-methylenetetrahydrofolate reductase [Pseudodesulfovibrio sp. zrk46]